MVIVDITISIPVPGRVAAPKRYKKTVLETLYSSRLRNGSEKPRPKGVEERTLVSSGLLVSDYGKFDNHGSGGEM
jgi:hypothetical protein